MTPHERLRQMLEAVQDMAGELENSREKSLLLTKLQEAGHWLEDDRKRVHGR